MHASVIDVNGDGVPDPANASISGTATLPSDDGQTRLTVTAELIDFAGRRPGRRAQPDDAPPPASGPGRCPACRPAGTG